jgi:hypothetical protein
LTLTKTGNEPLSQKTPFEFSGNFASIPFPRTKKILQKIPVRKIEHKNFQKKILFGKSNTKIFRKKTCTEIGTQKFPQKKYVPFWRIQPGIATRVKNIQLPETLNPTKQEVSLSEGAILNNLLSLLHFSQKLKTHQHKVQSDWPHNRFWYSIWYPLISK